jgi:L-amino acid N-acyltransferase YncA
MSAIAVREAQENDTEKVIEIFNYYIRNRYATYPREPVSPEFFFVLRQGAYSFYVIEKEEKTVGFGLLRPFFPFTALMNIATVTYFILPEHTRSGLGTILLSILIRDARKRGIRTLLANISSRNIGSLNFHRMHGFTEAGRVVQASLTLGGPRDVVWMQKSI